MTKKIHEILEVSSTEYNSLSREEKIEKIIHCCIESKGKFHSLYTWQSIGIFFGDEPLYKRLLGL